MKKVYVALPLPNEHVKYNVQKTQEDIELAVKFLLNDDDVEFVYNNHGWTATNNNIKHIDLLNTGHYILDLAECDMFVTLDTCWRYREVAKLNSLASQSADIEILRLPTRYFAPELYVAPKRINYGQYVEENDNGDYDGDAYF